MNATMAPTPATVAALPKATAPRCHRGVLAPSLTCSQSRPKAPSRTGTRTQRYEASASHSVIATCVANSATPSRGTSTPGRVSTITGQCQR